MFGYFLVFLGGGLGSMCRYGIAHVMSYYQITFPIATFLANVLSCFVLGLMVGLNLKTGINPAYKWLVMTGFCGGFSTFSTFTNETYLLLQSGQYSYVLANIIGSLLICLVFIYLGIKVAG